MSTPLWTNYLTQFVVAVVATISFGITFHVPKRHYLAGGLTGAVGWMVYILCYDLLGVTAPALRTVLLGLPQGPGHGISAAGHLPAGAGGGHLLHRLLFPAG